VKLLYIAPYCFGLEESLANAFETHGAGVERLIYGMHNEEKNAIAQSLYKHCAPMVRKVKKSFDSLGLLNPILNRSLASYNQNVLEKAEDFSPDVVFVVKGEVLAPETLRRLGQKAVLVSYHWDDPFLQHAREMDGTRDVRYQNMDRSYPLYDLTYVYDESYIPRLTEKGAKTVRYLMDWFEPEIYKELSLSETEKEKWGSDIAFVGSPYPNRIEVLEAFQDFNVGLWGPEFRWREFFRSHPFLKKQYRGEAPGREAARIYNASRIVLNIHDSFQCFSSVNNRTFQILACRAFQLVDDRQKLHELFDVGRELETFRSPEEAARKARHYLTRGAERDQIRERGYGKSKDHSATERARLILDSIPARAPR